MRHAILIVLLFALIHFLGLRDFTSVLNGTSGSLGMDRENAALLGIAYVLAYLAAILIAPTLVIAAVFIALWHKFREQRHEP